jgi:hypothetical protein
MANLYPQPHCYGGGQMYQVGDHRKFYFCAGFKKDDPGLTEVIGSVPVD